MTAARLAAAKTYLRARGLDHRASGDDWYLRSRVATPGSVVLRTWQGQRTHAAAQTVSRVARSNRRTRTFVGGGNGPMTSGMETSDYHINQTLRLNLKAMRARANFLARNNDYARAFLRLVKVNVVGPQGIALQAQITNARGEPVEADATKIETAWRAWGKRDACDFVGENSWLEMQQLWITSIARDGEVLVRRIKGAGPHGYQLQLIPAHMLDETHSRDLDNGHRIRMGIEFDANWRRVAYWISQDIARDPFGIGIQSARYVRVDAAEIWHDYVPEWIGQWRGIPWMATSIGTQKRLGEYEDSALMAAEEGAKKLAWLRTPTGDLGAMANGQVIEAAEDQVYEDPDDEADLSPTAGTLYTETGQGVHYAALPPGYEPVAFDSKYPEAAAADFMLHFVRRMSAGLGVPHHSLSGNLSGVNYTSSRTGELEVREVWKVLQTFMADRLCARVYAEWLPYAVLTGAVALPARDMPRYVDAATWQPRRWAWVDPVKDIDAALKEADAGISSISRIIREKGNDPDEVFAEIRRERERYADVFELLRKAGPAADPAPLSTAPTDPNEPDDGNDSEDPEDTPDE